MEQRQQMFNCEDVPFCYHVLNLITAIPSQQGGQIDWAAFDSTDGQ